MRGASFVQTRQGYLIFLQRLKKQASSLKGMSIQRSHVLFSIGDLAKIKESEHKRIEHGEHMGSGPFANLTRILPKSAITTVMQAIFDGPVSANQFQQTRGISLFGGETGNAIDDLLRTLEGMFYPSS